MNTPHKHAELIKKWADGAVIQSSIDGKKWHDLTHAPAWNCDHYRVKPEVTTSLSDDELNKIADISWKKHHGLLLVDRARAVRRDVVDAAIKQYIKENTK